MTTSLTWPTYLEHFQRLDKEETHFDFNDRKDRTVQCSERFVEGWMQSIWLREGVHLLFEKIRTQDRLILDFRERGMPLTWHFILIGKQKTVDFSACREPSISVRKGRFFLHGTGLHERNTEEFTDAGPFFSVTIQVYSKVLRSFVSDPSGEFPQELKHLLRSNEMPCYKRTGKTSPMMYALLQQILQCPHTGLTKRMYLESKAIELLALLMEEEAIIHRDKAKADSSSPDRRDRIQYAQEILMNNLTDPPSLMELARQVGLCDCNLKRGFKETFGTTVFGYLRDRRLEKAQQLLLEPWISVTEAARIVGYESRSAFTTAFKHRYGMSPKAYQMLARK